MTPNPFPTSESDFQALQASVAGQVDLDARLPSWPFRGVRGYATIFEYDRIMGGSFGSVLAELTDMYRDDLVITVGIEPRPRYFHDEYGIFPAFGIEGGRISTDYGAALRFEPEDDPTGSLGESLNVIAITGSSGAWSVFGQRDWEIGLLLTPHSGGAWLSTDVSCFAIDVDLDSIRSPVGWGTALSDRDREEFARQLREHGSGP